MTQPENLTLTLLSQHPEFVGTVKDWLSQHRTGDVGTPGDSLEEHLVDHNALPATLLLLRKDLPVGMLMLREEALEDTSYVWAENLYTVQNTPGSDAELLVTAASRIAFGMGYAAISARFDDATIPTALGWSLQEAGHFTLERPTAPPNYYEIIGGEETVWALVNRFYDLMDTLPEAQEIRQMHAPSLRVSRQKLFEFLSGWMGGPNLFVQKYGHPRLRARHLPFAIGTDARDQWLLCMDRALDEVVEDESAREALRDSFVHMADHMRNKKGA